MTPGNGVPAMEQIDGGESSAEELARAWNDALSEGDIARVEALTLTADQWDLIRDCTESEDPDRHAKDVADLRARLESEIGSVAAELAENGAHYRFSRARSLQSVLLEVGMESDSCIVTRDFTRHKVRTLTHHVNPDGDETQQMRFAATVEVEGQWFLTGVPGPLTPGGSSVRPIDPKQGPAVGPIRRGAPIRIPPQTVEGPLGPKTP